MSLFHTITHDEARQLRGISPRGIGMVVATLALGVAIGFAISEYRTVTDEAAQPGAGTAALSHAEFLRLNTTDLEYLTPMVPNLPSAAPVVRVDPFVEANVGSFGGLIEVYDERYGVEPGFMDINVTSYEGLKPITPGLAAFIDANVGSYEAVNQIWEENHTVDPAFLDNNVEPAAVWTQPPSGPR